MRNLSLGSRLALLLGAILLATTAILLGAVSVAAEAVLIDSTAERLEIGAGLLGDQPRNGPPVTDLDASEIVSLLGGQGTAVAILDGTGSTLATADNGAPPDLTATRLDPAAYGTALETGQTVREVVSGSAGRVLVVASPIELAGRGRGNGGNGGNDGNGNGGGPPFVPPGQAKKNSAAPPATSSAGGAQAPDTPQSAGSRPAIAQLAVSLGPVDAAIGQLRTQLTIVALVALGGGLLATILLSRRATRPLDRVARAASRLAAGDLGARTGVTTTDEVGAVARSFDDMADRLEAAFRAQRAFAADASHELQTPLAVLGGYVDVLQLRTLPPDDTEQVLGSMRREVDRLSRLAADLLLLARLDAGAPAMNPRPFDAADLVRDVGATASMIDPAVRVAVTADGALPVVADPDRLGQAVLNLAENAVRHAVSGTPVEIRAHRDGRNVAIEIANAGPPIPADELPRLFERFAQGTRASGITRPDGVATAGPQRAGHAGLGLPIARAIVEASGGRIDASSDEAMTRFTILLPFAEAADSQQLLSERGTLPA